jgi:hypothetical protein
LNLKVLVCCERSDARGTGKPTRTQ